MLIKATEFQDSEIPHIREKYFNPEKADDEELSVIISTQNVSNNVSPQKDDKKVTVEFVSWLVVKIDRWVIFG